MLTTVLSPLLVPPTAPGAFLVINGHEYHVSDDGTETLSPVTIGEATRAFAGGLRTTIQTVKREWVLNTTYLDAATYAQFLVDQQANNGIPLVTGDLVDQISVACLVLITNDVPVYDGGTRKRILTLSIREV